MVAAIPLIASTAFSALSNMGSEPSSSSQTPVDLTPPEFTALRGPLADVLQALFSQGAASGGGPSLG